MTRPELLERLNKLLFPVAILAELRGERPGKANAENWRYHLETVTEALKQLATEKGVTHAH